MTKTDPLVAIRTRNLTTPQNEPAHPDQVKNSAGGFTFGITDDARLQRFLTLGVDGGTYYVGASELAKDNAGIVLDMARDRPLDLVRAIVEISIAGRAPRQGPALFALAAVASLGDNHGRRAALVALPAVARTGTHLFTFVRYVEQFRGWGRGMRRAVSNWYLNKSVHDLEYQVVKYRNREGWTHRDLLRLAHPVPDSEARDELFSWICEPCGNFTSSNGLYLVEAFTRAQTASPREVARMITDGVGLSWEMLPDSALAEPVVWEALLDADMPQTALIRQLPRLTRLGLLDPFGHRATAVAVQLTSPERLRQARVHPISVLLAQRTYASGHSARGATSWTPSRIIVDALDEAFYASFGAVEPSGERMLLALDVSGSMGQQISGMPITCREASAALALVTAATESRHVILGFTRADSGYCGGLWGGGSPTLTPLSISPRQRLDDAVGAVSSLPFGGTDCALPMIYAMKRNLEIDTFVIYTDNETWAGAIHPHEALAQYRDASGIDARLAVVGMTATEFSIADPSDAGMLDIAGMDATVPSLIADFSRGDL